MNSYDYILIGGGAASVAAAQSIRERDGGSILIIKNEPRPPYDHPPLSKGYLKKADVSEDEAYSKFDSFYGERQIGLRTATEATALDTIARTVTLNTGEVLHYGKLLLATGSSAKKLEIPGVDAPNVFTLRTLDDSLALRQAVRSSKRVVVIGAGYIGMEVAAACCVRGLQATVIAPEPFPFQKFASETFGGFVKRYFEKKGVRFLLGEEVCTIEKDPATGMARGICTKGGQPVPADFIVAGVGATLNLDLAKAAGLNVDDKQGIHTDEFLRTSAPHVFAAGDVAYFKDIALGKQWHAEHHLNAKWQGEAVGRIMAGYVEPYNRVAYFFSDLFDIHMILRGDPQGGKSKVVIGDLDGAEFIELYGDANDQLTMGIAVSRDEAKLDHISDALDKMLREKVTVQKAQARLETNDRPPLFGFQGMAAVLGILTGTEALHFASMATYR